MPISLPTSHNPTRSRISQSMLISLFPFEFRFLWNKLSFLSARDLREAHQRSLGGNTFGRVNVARSIYAIKDMRQIEVPWSRFEFVTPPKCRTFKNDNLSVIRNRDRQRRAVLGLAKRSLIAPIDDLGFLPVLSVGSAFRNLLSNAITKGEQDRHSTAIEQLTVKIPSTISRCVKHCENINIRKRREEKMHFTEPIKPKRSLGSLRKANKTKPRSPDLTGQLRLQRHTAKVIVKQLSEDSAEEVVCNIAGWRNQDSSGSFLTVELSPRFVARPPIEGTDIVNSILNDKED